MGNTFDFAIKYLLNIEHKFQSCFLKNTKAACTHVSVSFGLAMSLSQKHDKKRHQDVFWHQVMLYLSIQTVLIDLDLDI